MDRDKFTRRAHPMTFHDAARQAMKEKENAWEWGEPAASIQSIRCVEGAAWEVSYRLIISYSGPTFGELQTVTFSWEPKSPMEKEWLQKFLEIKEHQ